MFGPERMGLVNDDLSLADSLVTVPLNPAFTSLNLGQAVLLVGYEWLMSSDSTPGSVLPLNGALPATKDELIDYATRTGAPAQVVENLGELEDTEEVFESIDEIWPDYPTDEDFFFEDEGEY